MDKRTFVKQMVLAAASGAVALRRAGAHQLLTPPSLDWSLNVSVIEACSCQPFCPCFFTGTPRPGGASHGDHTTAVPQFCRFNQAYRVNSGHAGTVRLDGVKFWYAGDAGANLRLPQWPWAELTFDAEVTQAQRDSLLAVLRHLRFYRPDRFHKYAIGDDAPIEWEFGERQARALLGGGRLGEVSLKAFAGQRGQLVTIQGLGYFGFPRNTGFVLMPNEVEAYRRGAGAFEHKGTNGFTTTVDMNAADFPAGRR